MIITHILGGLGNQMFQYAAGRSLSLRHNTKLLLDTSNFNGYDLHQGFELEQVFNINHSYLDQQELKEILGFRRHRWARPILKLLPSSNFRNSMFVKEPHFNYWKEWEFIPSHAYLEGYWQSERYFFDHQTQIRQDFNFKQTHDVNNELLTEKIRRVNSVSLHVRRGDYATNPQAASVHGLCSEEYYVSAIEYMQQRINNIHLFIFSDDIDWVQKNLRLGKIDHTYVNINKGKDSWRDMRLMSLCMHNILANSSFSWWGAWLNSNTQKIVLGPKKWFAKDSINSSDIAAPNWIFL